MWPMCKAQFPPPRYRRGNVGPFWCTIGRFHPGDHKAWTAKKNGELAVRWWRGWTPAPAAGGKPLLTQKAQAWLLTAGVAAMTGVFACSHFATDQHLHGWLHVLAWTGYFAFLITQASVLLPVARNRKRVKQESVASADQYVLALAARTSMLPGSAMHYSQMISSARLDWLMASLETATAENSDITVQQHILVQQVTDG